ncbi:MAG: hypothetical protein N2442_03275 [Spirochaetes bacterium]|nr:hypothetical protein [Spirochaetota bacterium]
MLWLSYLNAVSKKSNLLRALLCSFLSVFLLSTPLFSLESTYRPTQKPNTVQFHATLTPEEVARLQEALKDGYKAEITFILRVYEERKTLIFGNSLLYEAQHTYTARWDPVGREYQIISSTGEQTHFSSWEDFQYVYTHSPLFPIPTPKGNRVYTSCQAILKPKLFNPPLQILNSVGQLETMVSRWVRMDVSP